MELIPAIDLREGRCVRLLRGDFAAQTVYSEEPECVLEHYRALGARRVHVVDLDGARQGTQPNRAAVLALARNRFVSLQVGGGLRDLASIRELLEAGIERVVIGSIAVSAPEKVIHWTKNIEPEHIVLALDVRLDAARTPFLTTNGWQQSTAQVLWDVVERYARAGFVHVLCTDVSRDGALEGPNFELYAQAVRRYPQLQWQASGGVSSAHDLWALRECGVAAVISGRAMLENRIALEELRPFLPGASSPAST
jgi:phosphoribosylformimino-5-aminoimidazole carboxamide ribotide isomerase